jgi:hypothetical protein
VYLLHCTWRWNILCSKHNIDMRMNEWMNSTRFVFKLKRKKQVLALVPIEDLGFLSLVREIQRLSTRSAVLHSCKDGISHTRGRNPRSSIGTRVRTYYSQLYTLTVVGKKCNPNPNPNRKLTEMSRTGNLLL